MIAEAVTSAEAVVVAFMIPIALVFPTLLLAQSKIDESRKALEQRIEALKVEVSRTSATQDELLHLVSLLTLPERAKGEEGAHVGS